MARTVAKDYAAFKRSYSKSPVIKDAALAAGYALNTAKQGITPLPLHLRSFILAKQRKLEKLAMLADSVTAEQQESMMRGAILANVAEGKDRAVQSIKLGGQDKRVNMFTADSQVGVFVLEMPAHLVKRVNTTVLAGELQSDNEPRKS